MFWNEETQRRVLARTAEERARENVALFILTAEQAKKSPDQLDIAECAEYDRRAHEREMAWLTDPFHEAVVRLLQGAH